MPSTVLSTVEESIFAILIAVTGVLDRFVGNFITGSLKVPLDKPFNANAKISPSSLPPAKIREELAMTVMAGLDIADGRVLLESRGLIPLPPPLPLPISLQLIRSNNTMLCDWASSPDSGLLIPNDGIH